MHDTNIPTYWLTAIISDLTGDMFIQFPRELGDPIMNGMSAPDFKSFRDENDPELVKQYVHSCLFKRHQVLIKPHHNQYAGNESRVQYFAAKVFPFSVDEENKLLMRRLEIYG